MPDAMHPCRGTQGSGRLVAFPVGDRPAGHPNNLPLQFSSFVGRERQLAEVRRLLGDTRLLTLTGPGGCGKTRLAMVAANGLLGTVEDGAWMVELAPLANPALVPQAVGSVFGAREQQGRPLLQTLSDYVRTKELLLLLDNCEHLIGACAELVETLLRSCPGLRVLATSREAPGITGEVAWPVPPLSLPDLRRLPDVESLPRYESARLFVDRATAVRPTFALTEENAKAVAQVCYRLDGIPLAIELAAARAKVLSVEQIADRLGDGFGLLSAGGRTAMPRHQTLQATMDWSHGLLSDEEQVLFRRLSVFAGGFSLEAAESVCPGEDLERDEVLDLLSQLVDKSLVLVEEHDGEARYGLLETVGQYGRGKLEGAGEGTEVGLRHAGFFLRLAEEADPEYRGRRQGAWLERLEVEHDNLREALGRALEYGEDGLALRMAGALGGFWLVRGHLSEGRMWLEAALRTRVGASDPVRPRALLRAALIAREQGDFGRSVDLLEEGLGLARRLGNDSDVAITLVNLGWAALLRNELERASELTEEALALQREMNYGIGMAQALTVLGLLANAKRDYERAMALHEESLTLAREAEDAGTIALSMLPGALAALGLGDGRRARRLCEEGLRLSWRLKMVHPTASHLHLAASVCGWQGQPVRAGRLWGAAWETARKEGRAMATEEAVEYAMQSPRPTEEGAEGAPAHPAGLSAREAEVLRLVAQGMTNAEVAEKLFLSSRTVNWHLTSIYRKLGIHSRTEAARFAAEHSLL